MLSLPDAAAVESVLHRPLNKELRAILSTQLDQMVARGLADLTHLVVIQDGDSEADVIEACGWSPLVHPIDETRYGERDFTPYWAWLQDLGNWYEIIHPVGNSGFAYVFIIERGGTPFSAMCEEALRCAS